MVSTSSQMWPPCLSYWFFWLKTTLACCIQHILCCTSFDLVPLSVLVILARERVQFLDSRGRDAERVLYYCFLSLHVPRVFTERILARCTGKPTSITFKAVKTLVSHSDLFESEYQTFVVFKAYRTTSLKVLYVKRAFKDTIFLFCSEHSHFHRCSSPSPRLVTFFGARPVHMAATM